MSQRGTATSAQKRKRPDEETTASDFAPAAASTTPPPEKKPRMSAAVDASSDAPSVKPEAAASRCATCRKKVGPLGFRCRCEGTFCSVHRYADKHACGFDYEAAAREQIATKKKNLVVVAAAASTVFGPAAPSSGSSSTAPPEKETETCCVAFDASSDPAPADGMCVRGCGFFGAAATDNMCSKCYRDDFDALYAEGMRIVFGPAPAAASSSSPAAPPEKKKPKMSFPVHASSDDAAAAADNAVTSMKPPAVVNRCVTCDNKVANGSFFRCFATAKMCPKCDREHGANARIAAAAASTVFTPASSSAAPPEKKPAAAANRCATCRKKVGLLGFLCRCEGTFCSVHRYADKHACGFDYKTAAREQIAMQNPVVVADKMIDRI